VSARLVILNGDADREIDLETTRAVERGMKAAGKTVLAKIYPGLAHDDLCGDKAYVKDLPAFLDEQL
jgi:dipeptidyl aminopeptidase/acylaminoacyl peptidase